LLIGSYVIKVVPRVNNLGFVLNERLTATDNFKKVYQKVYWILRSLRPHASHTLFEVGRRLVVSLIVPHIRYGGIVYAGADATSQMGLNVAFRAFSRYIHSLRRLDHFRIQLLSFLYKVLHVRQPCYLFSLFPFASSARTKKLVVPAHCSLVMSQSFVVLGCRAWNALPHDLKILPTWR
jgi:hypothetical protein